jgi:orotate phosphoribosyltransferase
MTKDDLKKIVKKQIKIAPPGQPFVGTSGKLLDYYIDLRPLLLDYKFLFLVNAHIWSLCKNLNINSVAGMELGGAIFSSLLISRDFNNMFQGAIVRKEKSIRKNSIIFSHKFDKSKNTLLLDDIATTGYSLAMALDNLKQINVNVSHAFVVVDREEEAEKILLEKGIILHSIFKIGEFKI